MILRSVLPLVPSFKQIMGIPVVECEINFTHVTSN